MLNAGPTLVTGNTTQFSIWSSLAQSSMLHRDSDRTHIAWDIETTGFGWDDEITVSGFWFPNAHAELIVNTDEQSLDTDSFENHLQDISNGVSITVTARDDEQGLLDAMQQLRFNRIDEEYNRLVAYNADNWKGGFDLPFLRTRCVHHNTKWVFGNLEFADLFDPTKKRLNTTQTFYGKGTDINSLTGAHAILFTEVEEVPTETTNDNTEHPWYRKQPYDPFVTSGSASACYRRGDFLPVL